MNWPPQRDSKADVSSASPSSERIEELWVVCVYIQKCGATLLVCAWQREKTTE